MPIVYLDACCLNRPFDDQSAERVRLEAEAVLLILRRIESGDWQMVSSEVLEFEIGATPDAERRSRLRLILSPAQRFIALEEKEEKRAQELAKAGMRSLDALHLACAESGGAEVFLTTDDRLLHQAKHVSNLRVRVKNPLTWLQEKNEK